MLKVGDRFWEDAGLEVGCMKAISRRSSDDTQKPLTGITNSRKTVGPQLTSRGDHRPPNFLPHHTQPKYWYLLIPYYSNKIDCVNNYFLPFHARGSLSLKCLLPRDPSARLRVTGSFQNTLKCSNFQKSRVTGITDPKISLLGSGRARNHK